MGIQFENIVPWNGASDTGRDVRMKWERNFAKIGLTFQQVDELLGLLADELETKLSRVDADTAQSIITFLSGIHVGQYTPGVLGSGGAITVDPKTGHTRMEVDEGYFRKKATFNTVEIMHVTHRGGEDLYTPAGMVCTGVEEFDGFYRCYMNTDDGTKAVVNKFVVNDQAQCRDFNIKPGVYENVSNQYYWRLVIGVGEDYIDLSKTDCDTGSMIPLSGDKIAQLGNRTDPYRQNAIIISTVAADSPSFKQYEGIDGYSLVGKEVSVTSTHGNKYVGDFILKTGVNIATQLQVLENLIMTEIQSVEYVLNEKDNHLYNAAFTKDMEGWNPGESLEVYTNEDLLVANDGLLADADKIAEVMPYEGKLWLRLKDSSVIQPNGNITPPVQPGRYYVSLRYVCTGSGTISCGFEDTEMFHTAPVALTRNARMLEFTGIWDGTGDFLIRFTGDIYINLVALTNRPLDDYKLEVSSKLKQLSDSISAVVKSVDTVNKTIKDSGWLTTADGSKIWASCVFPDGTKAISLFDVTPDGIFLSGKHLNLKGVVTFESFSESLVEVLDQTFKSSETRAKSDVARQLGFSGYNDLVANAASGKAILVGGYLNLELIDVNTLISEKVLTEKLKAVSIETGRLTAKEGCKIGNLTITKDGAQAGGNAVFEDVGFTWFPIVGGSQESIAAQVRKTIINQIGKSTTILLNMNVGQNNYTYTVDLPTRDELNSRGISSGYGFRMTLIVTGSYFMPGWGQVDLNPRFRITSRPKKAININLQEKEWPDGEIHDNNDTRMEYIEMAKGDVLEFYYYSGVYYLLNHRS
nr:MAG TPA: tail protein [Caudoviricetes sp.]